MDGISRELLAEIIRMCQAGPVYRTNLRFLSLVPGPCPGIPAS